MSWMQLRHPSSRRFGVTSGSSRWENVIFVRSPNNMSPIVTKNAVHRHPDAIAPVTGRSSPNRSTAEHALRGSRSASG